MFFHFFLSPSGFFYRPRFQPWGTYYSQRLKPLAMGLIILLFIPNYRLHYFQRLKPLAMGLTSIPNYNPTVETVGYGFLF